MPRGKDPIWAEYEEEPNPTGKISLAKCKQCDWKQAGKTERMKRHFSSMHDNVQATVTAKSGNSVNI
jgi:hypothetical protein